MAYQLSDSTRDKLTEVVYTYGMELKHYFLEKYEGHEAPTEFSVRPDRITAIVTDETGVNVCFNENDKIYFPRTPKNLYELGLMHHDTYEALRDG